MKGKKNRKFLKEKIKSLPKKGSDCHGSSLIVTAWLVCTIITSIITFPFIMCQKNSKKVWLSPSNPHHLPRLSTPTSYRITSWSHSEANRGDKISLTRNGPIFQYPRHGTGTEPSYVVPEPPPFSIISPLRRLEGRNFWGSFGRFRQCSAMLLLRSTAANNIVVGRVAEWVAWAR